jgi:hypothetical protein
MNKRSLFRALGLTVVLWGAGVIAVNTKGIASCVPQVGLSAMLQKALFAPAASCPITGANPPYSCVDNGGTCVITTALSPGHGTPGTCKQTFAGCSCVPNVH